MSGPKRLIEVDLPIKEISKHARREKSIRHGHISTLHIWWARRPLAACRAVVLAALLPDPADPRCPIAFRSKAIDALKTFRDEAGGPPVADNPEGIRKSLLDFIARFSKWEASTDSTYLDCARTLVAAAYPDGPPLVVDPFAGGGAIPLEALRVGADAWAGDYNPVAALLLKVVLEEIPRYGQRLADAVREWGEWVKERVQADIGRLYPPDPDGAVPIAYLWARTVTCEGPGCGAEIPLLRQLWLAKRAGRQRALRMKVDRAAKRADFEVVKDPERVLDGTVKRGSATCPVCQYVTPVARVRAQAREQGGLPVRMVAVVRTYPGQPGRHYRVAEERDLEVARESEDELRRREKEDAGPLSMVPDEPLPPEGTLGFRIQKYGMRTWGDLFLPRQALALTTFAAVIKEAHDELTRKEDNPFARAVTTCLGIAMDRLADRCNVQCTWRPQADQEKVEHGFVRQALPMTWDSAEGSPFSQGTAGWNDSVEPIVRLLEREGTVIETVGQGARSDARELPLPSDSVPCVFTDPPYYDAVPYADLSDFFYVWLRRSIGEVHPDLLAPPLTEKPGEIVVNPSSLADGGSKKDSSFFEAEMKRALAEAGRVLAPDGIAVVVFAHKTTGGWEAMVQALIDARWTVTGSWPLDTEMATRLRARDSAALASSVHIVCRPRSDRAGIGDWRSVLGELEERIHEWLPRLSAEGIEGADAIFACLGPALEVYSRYERVETAAGEPVPLSPPQDNPSAPAFLPAVWGAVAQQALAMIFEGGEAEGFEEDARLTALWLWTLRSAAPPDEKADAEEDAELEEDEEAAKAKKVKGLVLDYDTARKIAQPLGAHLETLGRPGGIVEVKKGVARLLPVADRRKVLLGDGERRRASGGTLFEADQEHVVGSLAPGETTLDRVQQAMLLFGEGHGDLLRRLLAEPGYVQDQRFRRLAQALSSLYPPNSQEKRWVDGVLAAARSARP